jgi:NO-binding membrane sensor protein with MHYT domain
MNSIATMNGSYDYRLVTLSIALAMVASYAALDLAGRVTSAQGWARGVWLSCGATAMGTGVCAMHYVGMLALRMPLPVAYHIPTVLLSLLAAISASGVALFAVSRPKMGRWQEISGSLAMASGIAIMHYTGMASMRCSAVIAHDPRKVALSILLAIATSLVALRLSFRARDETQTNWRKLMGALIMGGAISLMHYSAMWGTTFYSSSSVADLTGTLSLSAIGIVVVGATSFLVSGVAIVLSFFDRFVGIQKTIATAPTTGSCISRQWRRRFQRLSGQPAPTVRATTSIRSGLTIRG